MTLRESILAATDTKRVPVEVPEWGATVHVREMSGRQRDELDAWFMERQATGGKRGFRVKVVALCACDETGAPLFTEADEAALADKSAAALERIFEAAAKLNKLLESNAEAERSDFSPTQAAASGSV